MNPITHKHRDVESKFNGSTFSNREEVCQFIADNFPDDSDKDGRIRDLKEALKIAREYVAATHGSLVGATGINTIVKPDLDLIDAALNSTTKKEGE